MWLDEVRDETSNVLIRSFVFNRLLYLIESSDSLEGRSLLLTLAVPRNESFASLKDFGTWREIQTGPEPRPDKLARKRREEKKKIPLFAPEPSKFGICSTVILEYIPEYLRIIEGHHHIVSLQWYFGFKQGISIVCLIDWGGIVLLTQRSHICHPLCRS